MEKTIAIEKQKSSMTIKTIILCGIFTALIAIGAFIRVPLPIIPFTLQFPLVCVAAIFLKRKAVFSVLAYILIGLVGFPIFTKGGGLSYVFEPTFGFLLGFMLTAFLIGLYLEKTNKYTVLNIFIACVIGIIANYFCGVLYMYLILNFYIGSTITIGSAIMTGALVFLPKDLILCLLSAFIGAKTLPALKKANLL